MSQQSEENRPCIFLKATTVLQCRGMGNLKNEESLPSDPLYSLRKPPEIASILIYKGQTYLPSQYPPHLTAEPCTMLFGKAGKKPV